MKTIIILGVLISIAVFGELAPPDCFCDNCEGLEQKDDFYSFSSTYGRANRALKGTKKILGIPGNQSSFYFTIKASTPSTDFNVSRLCMMIKNVGGMQINYEGPHSPVFITVNANGAISMATSGSAVAVMGMRPFDNTEEWTKWCLPSGGLFSLMRINLHEASTSTRMMVKALHMRACPHRIRPTAETPVCRRGKELGDGSTYFDMESSHKGGENALSGSNRAVRAPAGQSLSFTIKPPQGDNGFVITSLCIQTKNADRIMARYQGLSGSGSMMPGYQGSRPSSRNGGNIGPVLERKTVSDLNVWTETCFGFNETMRSQVKLTVSSTDKNLKIVAKGLLMKACPWIRSHS